MSDIQKILDEHEKRIKNLENILESTKGKPKIKKKISLLDLIEELKSDGFFDAPKTRKEIVDKMAEGGNIYPPDSLNGVLLKAIKARILGRVKKDDQWVYVKR